MSNASYFVPKKFRNPLLKFPREHACVCGSGEMFKDCCLKYQRRAIPAEWAERLSNPKVWEALLKGERRLVPPKEAISADVQDTPMPVVPMVPEGEEGVLAGAAEAAPAEPVAPESTEAMGTDAGGGSDAALQSPGGEEISG